MKINPKMDKVVHVFTGGPISQTGSGVDLVGMEVNVIVFRESPSFQTVVVRIKSTFGWDEPGVVIEMEGRYDVVKGSKVHALLMLISCEDDWDTYKEVVLASQVQSLEAVVKRLIIGEVIRKNANVMNGSTDQLKSLVELSQGPLTEEQPSQDVNGVGLNSDAPPLVDSSYMHVSLSHPVSEPVTDFNRAVMTNDLDNEMFRDGTDRDIESDEGWSSTENEGLAPLFSSEEGRVLQSVMGVIPLVHAFKDVRIVGNVVCENELKSRDGIADLENELIRKDMLFACMEDMKV